jgi:PTH1 family peptidyl-tRNA hydrolase
MCGYCTLQNKHVNFFISSKNGRMHVSMSIVVAGLGNPGKEYEKTRHNAGRMAVALLAKQESLPAFELRKAGGAGTLVSEGKIGREKTVLILPETFMNLSGKSVKAFVKSKKAAENLVIVRDDLDMPLGIMKMQFARGSGGHKGVESVMRSIGTDAFVQLKIGIAKKGKNNQAKKPIGDEAVAKYVTGKFAPAEDALLKKTLKKAARALQLFVEEGLEKAMLEANTR